ncbi:hypothetical protein BC936DRAFT_139075 [Jimgerdemannia flammicorona]|uniref:Uncharacterized protein n=2 Tax=Jimgerdemannia flammicorona TaxID=994334 RepID=A0A433DHV2_9FUNG|nr:hypothetical protein BC936DRAFT_139075 [Jimgerdemannia flammicorona]RUS35167.1 hypothetical protein BC938DRAFT_474884 [Jimgerdemannia flammicorona]
MNSFSLNLCQFVQLEMFDFEHPFKVNANEVTIDVDPLAKAKVELRSFHSTSKYLAPSHFVRLRVRTPPCAILIMVGIAHIAMEAK